MAKIIRNFRDRIINEDKKTFVEAYKTTDAALAGLIKEVLEDHNILCYLDNYYSMHILYPLVYRGIRVMVYRDCLEDASRILDLFFKGE
jgi:hypothetical protein